MKGDSYRGRYQRSIPSPGWDGDDDKIGSSDYRSGLSFESPSLGFPGALKENSLARTTRPVAESIMRPCMTAPVGHSTASDRLESLGIR